MGVICELPVLAWIFSKMGVLSSSSENVMFVLDNTLIRRKSADFRGIEQSIEKIGATIANVIIFGEIGMGREQVSRFLSILVNTRPFIG